MGSSSEALLMWQFSGNKKPGLYALEQAKFYLSLFKQFKLL